MGDDDDSDHSDPPADAGVPSEAPRSSSRWRIDTRHPAGGKGGGELFRNGNRAVAPPRAAQPDRQVRPPLGPVSGQQLDEQVERALEEPRIARVGRDVGRDGLAPPRQRAQCRDPVRVRQEADVEHHVEPARQAPLVAERLHRQRQLAAPRRERALHVGLQLVHGQGGRVDHDVGAIPERPEHFALLRDSGLDVARRREGDGVAASRRTARPAARARSRGKARARPAAGSRSSRSARSSAASTLKSRLRTSTPSASGRSPAPSTSRSTSESGMLSTTSKPASSSARIAVVRPAPDGPVTSTTSVRSARPPSVIAPAHAASRHR